MPGRRVIHTVSCHAGGEVGDVIVGGVPCPPGDTMWERRDWIARDGALRDLMLGEPRGGVFRHVNLLVPPVHPDADMGFIVMEPEDTPPMSGSNAICVTTVLLETGIVAMREPVTELVLEAPGGLVPVRAECRDGRVERVALRNLPSFADRLDAEIEVPGWGRVGVDIAYGGDSFVVVAAADLGFPLAPEHAGLIAEAGRAVIEAANAQIGFRHPENPAWDHISFALITTPTQDGEGAQACVIRPAKIDRSPTGTGLSARMAVRHARGLIGVGERLVGRSIIGSRFEGRILEETTVGGRPAIVPEIAGRAWLTGTHQHWLEADDPWPRGIRLGDTWPGARACPPPPVPQDRREEDEP